MDTGERTWNNGTVPRRIKVVQLEAYHVLSALKDYFKNPVTTSSLVPVLGADNGSGRALQEASLTRSFKHLIAKAVPGEDIFADFGNIKPFLDVMKTCDSKQSKLIIRCSEAICKFTQCDADKFNHKDTSDVINTTFEELVGLFSTNVEPKEDLLTLKILKALRSILHSRGGNLITNANICLMFKMLATLLTARNRNTAIRKLIHDEIIKLLQDSLGQYSRHTSKNAKSKTLARRISSTFIFISLLLTQRATPNPFNFHVEDSFLSPEDKDTLARFRNDLSLLSQNVISFPSLWNEFCYDVGFVGLETLNQIMELRELNERHYSIVLPIVQVFVTNAIYRMCFTESLSLYSLVLRALKNSLFCFRVQMKSQTEALLSHIVSSVANYVNGTKTQNFKNDIIEMNLEFLVDICHDSQLIMEIYANYDCDVRCINLLDMLIKSIVTCLGVAQDLDTTKSSDDQTKAKPLANRSSARRKSSSAVTKQPGENTSAFNPEYMALHAIQGILKILAFDMPIGEVDAKPEIEPTVAKAKMWKEKLGKAASIFNTTKLGDDWIPLMKEMDMLPEEHTPKDVAMFLKCIPGLDLEKVGEYLGTHKNPAFMDQVRSQFAKLHNFGGMPIVMAIRLFLSSFRLPGESQQIERIIEVFANTYFESQPLVESNAQNEEGKQKKDETLPDNKKPRWVVQEALFWQLNFTSFGIANLGSINDHDANENETAFERFKKQFMQNEMENILTNERTNLINDAIKDEALMNGVKLNNQKTSPVVEDDPKIAKLKDPKEVEGIIKDGFAYVANSDVIFVLSYSIIMLNTDQHNSQIKKKMKLEDFVRNNKGINNGKNLPYEFLEDIYTTIKHHEIKLHKSGEKNSAVVQYDDFYWVDHVLQRQRLMGSFNIDLSADILDIKQGIFHLLCNNNFAQAINNTFNHAQSVPSLKRCIRVLWLMMRIGIVLKQNDIVNEIFQMTSINVSDSLGYKCQLSLAFILTSLALASDMFDRKSWEKTMDTMIKLYYLNLLPLSFAALDIDPKLYGACTDITDMLVPPTIRFKRNSDLKRGAGWLGGWTNFISFSKPASSSNIELTDDDDDFYLDESLKAETENNEKGVSPQPFLFLFDVQSGCETTMYNKYFNMELLKQGMSPIVKKEDSEAINEVTQAFSSDGDKDELLPQVLAYMNLRLAFLNIYNINSLFMGATTNVSVYSYISFLKVVFARALETTIEEREIDTVKSPQPYPPLHAQGTQTSTKAEGGYAQVGALLEPCHRELTIFRSAVEPVFILGVFTKSCNFVLERTKYALKENYDHLDEETSEMFKATVICLVKCFHLLGSALIVPDAKAHIPCPDDVLKTLRILNDGDTLYEQICQDETWSPSDEAKKRLLDAVGSDNVMSTYVPIIMLKLVVWLTNNSNVNVKMPNGSPRHESDKESRDDCASDTQTSQSNEYNKDDDDGINWHEICTSLSAWLLHMLVNFHNGVFYNHVESVSKVLASIVSNRDIVVNEYFIKVTLAATQRLNHPSVPFQLDESLGKPKLKRERRLVSVIEPVIQPLVRSKRHQALLQSHTTIKYLFQTLLTTALFGGQSEKSQEENYNDGYLAIQLLVELRTFGNQTANEEVIWLYVIHALTIICFMGPHRLYLESMKALGKLLLKENAPTGRCSKITHVVRIFDYVLAPSLANKLQYPLSYARVLLPVTMVPKEVARTKDIIWEIPNPFSSDISKEDHQPLWMQNVIMGYMASHKNTNAEDLNQRKAVMSNLICQYMLSNMHILNSMELEKASEDVIKFAASNLECLLYSSDQEACSDVCIKRFITVTNYILNVIILSNGDEYNDVSSDTYVESLKNFLLVLLTSPELKQATESCLQHFTNDVELKECINLIQDFVDITNASPGEYVLASLLSHIFSTSEFLKDLFLDILKVVFFTADAEEELDADAKEEQGTEAVDDQGSEK
ncbi:guanyl-nucleotide exchange factor like protein [Babesia gibsoni]|uniref:Guanyl-nucleotide exchange factor like protein n=1 Tax=Babesia gibsoni TaxID=33632 RepID=A0AAD8UV98_BABGI|nr:guanyl-nucleotide exchange factor like protein [Babesia gibsoni]